MSHARFDLWVLTIAAGLISGCATQPLLQPQAPTSPPAGPRVIHPVPTAQTRSAPQQLAEATAIPATGGPPAGSPSTFPSQSNSGGASSTPSLSEFLVQLETLRQHNPEDFATVQEMIGDTQGALPAQHQQLLEAQLLAVALNRGEQSSAGGLSPQMTVAEGSSTPAVVESHLATPLPVSAPPAKPPVRASQQAGSQPPRTATAPRYAVHQPERFPAVDAARPPPAAAAPAVAHLSDAPQGVEPAAAELPIEESGEPKAYQDGQWRDQLAAALDGVASELARTDLDGEEKNKLEIYQRLLHAISNNRQQAVAPIEQLGADEQEFWKHQLHSLLMALDADGKHAASRRAALALRELREATHRLANISTLDLRNAALCSEVVSYGVLQEFDSYTFRPGDEVVLYIEVDNFAALPKGDQYETELHGEYEILDERGNRVVNVVLPVDQQVSNNRRRDYFIPYLIRLPAEIESGRYRLQLTIEDVIGKKSNQAMIDFRIR